MSGPKVLIVGNGGRESSLAWRLARDCSIFAFCRYPNPSLLHFAEITGGVVRAGNHASPTEVASFACEQKIDIALVANDEALACGVVDRLLECGVETVGPTKAAAQIEWDKAFARRLLSRHFPELNPAYWIVSSAEEIARLFRFLERARKPVAVKPQGLTAGRGVRVMGRHLTTFDQAASYANEVLTTKIGGSAEVVIEERMDGIEFTMQALTDGQVVLPAPATYDYPYRYDGDRGPGTGGLGSFAGPESKLTFMTDQDYFACNTAIQNVLGILRDMGLQYSGTLTGCFFITREGLRIMEFNARPGEPECINLMSLLNTPLIEVLDAITRKKLDASDAHFEHAASVVKYLVPPEYCVGQAKAGGHFFEMDTAGVRGAGANVFFAAARKSGSGWQSISESRCVAIEAKSST